jgi:NADP-dependent aldehyde dehydrogenase
MQLSGQSIIGTRRATASGGVFYAVNPRTGERLEPAFHSAGDRDLDEAVALAAAAAGAYRALPRSQRVEFLREIAAQLESLGRALIERVTLETALSEARARGELERTANQLRFLAGIVEEGSWVDARIDTGDAKRKPAKPDVRSMLRPLGPVAIFCAGNFPLAFSVAGGDTASALAAGNPVVVNAHYSHPGTAEMCGVAIAAAARRAMIPDGVFSLLISRGPHIGQVLVAHPLIKAAAFTGSRTGGLALAETARSRPEPIPFFGEMSGSNPVFVLPHAWAQRGDAIVAGLAASVTGSVGQFCTKPGLVLVEEGRAGDALVVALGREIGGTRPAPMLNAGILENYRLLVEARTRDARVRRVAQAAGGAGAGPALFETDADTLLGNPDLAAATGRSTRRSKSPPWKGTSPAPFTPARATRKRRPVWRRRSKAAWDASCSTAIPPASRFARRWSTAARTPPPPTAAALRWAGAPSNGSRGPSASRTFPHPCCPKSCAPATRPAFGAG